MLYEDFVSAKKEFENKIDWFIKTFIYKNNQKCSISGIEYLEHHVLIRIVVDDRIDIFEMPVSYLYKTEFELESMDHIPMYYPKIYI